MLKNKKHLVAGLAAAAACMGGSAALAADALSLRAGAAKIDITPASDSWAMLNRGVRSYESVHDPIFARVLIVDNGQGPVAMVALDLLHLMDMKSLRERIQREIGIAPDHIIVTASHNHSAPRLWGDGPFAKDAKPHPEDAAYAVIVYDKILAALKTAKASMQPARMGYGTGLADVSVNRDEYQPPRGWIPGANQTAPSDKTVRVMKFESLSGQPIAVWFNYAVHSIVTLNLDVVTGDLAGVAQRVVEEQYDNKAVALFTMGAAGNQHPKYIGPGMAIGGDPNFTPGAIPADLPLARRLAFPAMEAQGWMLGSEVVRVAKKIQANVTTPRIAAAETEKVCPTLPNKLVDNGTGQDRTNGTPIRLGVVRFDDIALGWVSAEVVFNIDAHLKSASPLANTVMVTMSNGRSGYMVDDASYDTPNFETRATNPIRGCAENAIVYGLVDLIKQTGPAVQVVAAQPAKPAPRR